MLMTHKTPRRIRPRSIRSTSSTPAKRNPPAVPPLPADELVVVSHYRYDPSSPAEPGLLTINGVFFAYVPNARGWGIIEASTGQVHNIEGRLILRACSCNDYYERRYQRPEGPQYGTCRHMLGIVKAQRTFTVCGLETEITNKGVDQ